ncbi:MAG: hypothetical protein JNM01_05400 [Delftia acidovorans]|nr:hypothetical protein [Delftia acidovorans]
MSTNPKIRWTQAEMENLLSIYSKYSDADLMKIFGRSISAIEQKARRIGIPIRPGVGRGYGLKTLWTQQEDETLKSMIHEKKRSTEIATLLGRSAKAVDIRAVTLGLRGRYGKCSHLPVGSERLGISGTPERKISLDGAKHENWKRIDEIEWEAAHGPISAGMVLFKLPGKPRTLENLRLVRRSDVPMFAARDALTPELRKLIDLKCRFSFALNRIEELNPDVPRDPR